MKEKVIRGEIETRFEEIEGLKQDLLECMVKDVIEGYPDEVAYSCGQMDKHHLIHEDFIDAEVLRGIEDCIEDIEWEFGEFQCAPVIIELFMKLV